LSDTNINGIPCVANMTLSLSTVWAAKVQLTTNTSEKASTTTNSSDLSTLGTVTDYSPQLQNIAGATIM